MLIVPPQWPGEPDPSLAQRHLHSVPPRGLGKPQVKCREFGAGVLRGRQMQSVGRGELGRKIADDLIGEKKVRRAVAEPLAIGPHRSKSRSAFSAAPCVKRPARRLRDSTALTSRFARSLTTSAAPRSEYQATAFALSPSATRRGRRAEASR